LQQLAAASFLSKPLLASYFPFPCPDFLFTMEQGHATSKHYKGKREIGNPGVVPSWETSAVRADSEINRRGLNIFE
jgi:hypothetical protein